MKQFLLFVIFCLSFVLLSGCGPQSRVPINYVEGIVTLDGKPAAGAAVIFVPPDENSGFEGAAGTADEDGRFKMSSINGLPEKGAMEGEYKVVFSLTVFKKLDKPVWDDTQGKKVSEKYVNVIPLIYQNPDTTPLSATVVKGKNKIDFALESSPKK
ncbi:hypothetical protein FACS18942_02060 [Planctomycetales bacterium]|nr:hypothetical protein FACS18942_02060 [Planctomycetales bacterium]